MTMVVIIVMNLPLGNILVTFIITITKYWTTSHLREKIDFGSQLRVCKLAIWLQLVLESPTF